MRKRDTIARYRTRKGAERYATEIALRFPGVKTHSVPNGFEYSILVTLLDGATALAAKRPKNYANLPYGITHYLQPA